MTLPTDTIKPEKPAAKPEPTKQQRMEWSEKRARSIMRSGKELNDVPAEFLLPYAKRIRLIAILAESISKQVYRDYGKRKARYGK